MYAASTTNVPEARNLCCACAGVWPRVTDPVLKHALATIVINLSELSRTTNVPKYGTASGSLPPLSEAPMVFFLSPPLPAC